MKNQIHPTAIVDGGTQIGEDTFIWLRTNVCAVRPLVK